MKAYILGFLAGAFPLFIHWVSGREFARGEEFAATCAVAAVFGFAAFIMTAQFRNRNH